MINDKVYNDDVIHDLW